MWLVGWTQEICADADDDRAWSIVSPIFRDTISRWPLYLPIVQYQINVAYNNKLSQKNSSSVSFVSLVSKIWLETRFITFLRIKKIFFVFVVTVELKKS